MEVRVGETELGREKDMVLCKENVVAGGSDLHRLLPFGTFFTAVGFNT